MGLFPRGRFGEGFALRQGFLLAGEPGAGGIEGFLLAFSLTFNLALGESSIQVTFCQHCSPVYCSEGIYYPDDASLKSEL